MSFSLSVTNIIDGGISDEEEKEQPHEGEEDDLDPSAFIADSGLDLAGPLSEEEEGKEEENVKPYTATAKVEVTQTNKDQKLTQQAENDKDGKALDTELEEGELPGEIETSGGGPLKRTWQSSQLSRGPERQHRDRPGGLKRPRRAMAPMPGRGYPPGLNPLAPAFSPHMGSPFSAPHRHLMGGGTPPGRHPGYGGPPMALPPFPFAPPHFLPPPGLLVDPFYPFPPPPEGRRTNRRGKKA